MPLPDEVAVAIAIIQLLGELRSVGLSSLKARCRRFSPCFLRCELLFDRAFTESFFVNYTRLLLILISLVRPLKCRNPTSVGLWNERMTNRSTVDEGSQKLFSVIWGRFGRPVVHRRWST